MIKAVFFDMNETLLNLSLLKESFDKNFHDDFALKYWFTKLLHTSTVLGSMNEYKNFGELSEVVLENVFYESGKELTEETKAEILGSFRKLPAYDDVFQALKILRKNNIKVVVVSNSSLEMIKEQLINANIFDLVDTYYSVDSVKKYKPFSDIYSYVANEEKLPCDNIAMVASHDWDLFGAKKVGFTTAYIKRKKEIYNPYYAQPDICNTNLIDLVKEIVKIK
ncbi:haloacid dehalogenase type II [Clostridium sp. cel8]|uniref:haloacid dehalogenase type II n=1 Tax=Clostridium sp. cel8 TaxID=2663123 RepID=UPI0015F5B799|nr:haloacid dehalogenase type II [Clostridium sp. cel8]MBA5850756.1 haloacid dehalogenase type II [Clostridium sp. cel8]